MKVVTLFVVSLVAATVVQAEEHAYPKLAPVQKKQIIKTARQLVLKTRKDISSRDLHLSRIWYMYHPYLDYAETLGCKFYVGKLDASKPIATTTNTVTVGVAPKHRQKDSMILPKKRNIREPLKGDWMGMSVGSYPVLAPVDCKLIAKESLKLLLDKHPEVNSNDLTFISITYEYSDWVKMDMFGDTAEQLSATFRMNAPVSRKTLKDGTSWTEYRRYNVYPAWRDRQGRIHKAKVRPAREITSPEIMKKLQKSSAGDVLKALPDE